MLVVTFFVLHGGVFEKFCHIALKVKIMQRYVLSCMSINLFLADGDSLQIWPATAAFFLGPKVTFMHLGPFGLFKIFR